MIAVGELEKVITHEKEIRQGLASILSGLSGKEL
jgi:hypothetical protein